MADPTAPGAAQSSALPSNVQQAGQQTQQTSDALQSQNAAQSAANPAALAAKIEQSLTFGLDADVVGVFNKKAGNDIRTLADQYDQHHPLAAAGIDLATGVAQSALVPEAKVASVLKNPWARQAVTGAAAGALTGAGAGGNADARMKHAAEGAVGGAATAMGLGAVGTAVGGVINRTGAANQAGLAFDKIKAALAKDGLTPEQAVAKLKADPNLRIADISPSVASAARKASKASEAADRQVGDIARADAAAQTERMTQQMQPLMPVKQKLLDDLSDARKAQNAQYAQTRKELVPLTDDLKKLLANPTVAPFVKSSLADLQAAHQAGNLAQLPKYKIEKEMPTVQVDILQRKIRAAAEAPEINGTEAKGTLMSLHAKLSNLASSPTLSLAQQKAAEVGGAERAQDWGAQFSKGKESAKIDEYRSMGPLDQQHAKIGFVTGLEDYIRDKTRMSETSLLGIADSMNKPEMQEVLGKSQANQVKQMFAKEAARVRATTEMSKGNRSMDFEENKTESLAGHGLNVMLGHAAGTAGRLLMSMGMSPEQSKNIIDLATSPGGFAKLEKAGVSKNMLDKLRSKLNTHGLASAKAVVNNSNMQSRPDNR